MNDNGQFTKGSIPWNKNKKIVKYKKTKCLFCGKERLVTPSVIKYERGKFCNRKCRTEYQKGKPPLPPGWKHSEEVKKKIGEASFGHELSEASRKKISLKNSGKGNPAWKGGVSIFNKKIRTSSEYKKWRKAVLERDNHTCQICGAINCKLEVDHIKEFAIFPELRLDINNGRTLCQKCHKETPNWGNKNSV